MGRPRQVSDEQILEAMRETVVKHGPAVSLEVVAETLDVSAPAILKRFGTREALMLAALRPPDNPPWVALLEEGPDGRPLRAQLLDTFSQIDAFMQTIVPCMTALRESGIPPSRIFPAKGPVNGLKGLQRWLSRAKARGLITASEVDAAAYAILGSLQTRTFFSHLMNVRISARERREYLEELATLFTRALTSS